jgi:hypothetical protein
MKPVFNLLVMEYVLRQDLTLKQKIKYYQKIQTLLNFKVINKMDFEFDPVKKQITGIRII